MADPKDRYWIRRVYCRHRFGDDFLAKAVTWIQAGMALEPAQAGENTPYSEVRRMWCSVGNVEG